MKTKIISITVIVAALLTISPGMKAQEEIIFSPADLIPHEEGYYITGVWVDENNDDIPEFHNQCDDYYEVDPQDPQLNHVESGTQQDFTYEKCMIMPNCEHKNDPIEPPVALGYIQIAPCYYSGTDSASLSYILTPPLENLVSLTLETSSDVSINEQRNIPYNIEYSKDFGVTWEINYIHDNVANQGGYRVTYNIDHSFSFEEMINASKEGPIVLRLITNDIAVGRPNKGQFVKVHSIVITAEKSEETSDENRIKRVRNSFFRIYERTIVSDKEQFDVYNISGQLVGSGFKVTVTHSGIYFIRTNPGNTQKVFIR